MKFLTMIAVTLLLFMCPESIETSLWSMFKKITLLKTRFIKKYISSPWPAYCLHLLLPGFVLTCLYYGVCTFASKLELFFFHVLVGSLCFNSYALNYAIFKNKIPHHISPKDLLRQLNISLLTPTIIYILLGPVCLFLHRIHICLVRALEATPEEKVYKAAEKMNFLLDWFFIRIGCLAFALMSDFSKILQLLKINCFKNPTCLDEFYQSIVDNITKNESDEPANTVIRGLIMRSFILILTCHAVFIAQFGLK